MININKDDIVFICKTSKSMGDAAYKLGIHYNTLKRYAIKYNCWNPNQGGKGTKKCSANKNAIKLVDILNGLYPTYQTYKLSKRLIKEGIKEHKCEHCGLSEWNGLPIPLELHHIDGNRFNHKLENLMFVCPNCHAQTESFRSKNIKKHINVKE